MTGDEAPGDDGASSNGSTGSSHRASGETMTSANHNVPVAPPPSTNTTKPSTPAAVVGQKVSEAARPPMTSLRVSPPSSTSSAHDSLSPGSVMSSNSHQDSPPRNSIPQPETDSGVALPAETAAETEAVLEAIAADERGDKSDSDNDAEEILEESPDKRWSKRREKVKQRDVPGIDVSFLAMDNETGNEVVWNEVQFSERKNFRDQEEKIRSVFDNLAQLEHVNLVKFHKYWTDTKSEKPRIIFITEYMSSGSMSRFLQRARSSESLSNIRMWKKWTIQILSALNYLHSCDPPIAHANLSSNTIFIQQNGLIKIGCVAPDAIHHHVKTFRENIRNLHYIAPEYEYLNEVSPSADIYSFGVCALEMATRGTISTNGAVESASHITQESLQRAIGTLDNPLQRDFIRMCVDLDPKLRPTARSLLFHPVLFEVHSLKLLAAHVIVNSKMIDHLSEDDLRVADTSKIAVECCGRSFTFAEVDAFPSCKVDLDKFLEDVKNGIYPLIAFAPTQRPIKLISHSPSSATLSTFSASRPSTQSDLTIRDSGVPASGTSGSSNSAQQRSQSSGIAVAARRESADDFFRQNSEGLSENHSEKTDALAEPTALLPTKPPSSMESSSANSTITSTTGSIGSPSIPETNGEKPLNETRRITGMKAYIRGHLLSLVLQLEDCMNRRLSTRLTENDKAEVMVAELIVNGFVCEADSNRMCQLLAEVIDKFRLERSRTCGDAATLVESASVTQQTSQPDTPDSAMPTVASEPATFSANINATAKQPPTASEEDLTDDDSSPPPSMVARSHGSH